MATELNIQLLLRQDTAEQWSTINPVLGVGEPGVEYSMSDGKIDATTLRLKIGDGKTAWNTLPYASKSTNEIQSMIDTSIGQIDIPSGGAVYTVSALTEITNTPENGDIAIVLSTIVGDKVSRTAYVWDATANNEAGDWVAFDGNYNAGNVYFDDDLTFTSNIGALTLESGKTKGTYAAAGKSLEEVIKGIMAKTIPPSITPPSYTFDSIVSSLGKSSNKPVEKAEIGTKITSLSWEASYTDGKYSYKSLEAPTSEYANCVASYSMTCDVDGSTTTPNAQDGTWTFTTPYQVTSIGSKKVGSITTTCKIADSTRTPVNNIGDEVDGKIVDVDDVTATKTFNVTGYRAWFCGYKNGDSAIKDPSGKADATLITGDQIRSLGNSADGSWKSSMSVSKMQQMFFAAPAGKGYKPKVADASTTAPQTVQGPFTVYVKGANNYVAEGDETTNGGIAYDVWYVNNTSAASGSATLNITKA